jgi:hypothetical protein
MDFKRPLLLLPIILVVIISGCTIPICIPFVNIGNCERVVEYEDDVIVIKSLDALPQTVSPGQQIRLVAYIQNLGKEPVPQDDLGSTLTGQKIIVNLYDYCEGLFSDVKITCEGKQKDLPCTGKEECKCEIDNLLPGQTKEIDWVLKAGDKDQVPLKTECDLKVSVTYPYKTTSLTMMTFIDYQEMQRQLSEGTFRKKESYIVSGYGPVKPRITVEDQQPIPVQQTEPGRTMVALRIKNSGKGYLCRPAGTIEGDIKTTGVICDSKIPGGAKDNIKIEWGDLNFVSGGSCTLNPIPDEVTLIQKESPPLLCEIELRDTTNLPKETTKHVTTKIEYMYEFRKELRVTIEPKT